MGAPIVLRDISKHYFDENLDLLLLGPPLSQPTDRERTISYMDQGLYYVATLSLEPCRICEKWAGGRGFVTDGYWLWPKYLSHYLKEHGWGIPAEFDLHLQKQDYHIDKDWVNKSILSEEHLHSIQIV